MAKAVLEIVSEQNHAERAFNSLRNDLLSCRLGPGSRLNISDICNTLSISQGAVREALSRLVSEDLVVAEFNRGYRAAPAPIEELESLVEARSNIDGICLRLALSAADLEWEVAVVAANHRLLRIIDTYAGTDENADAYAAANRAFNDAIMAACDNKWLLKMQSWLYDQTERFRRQCLPTLPKQIGSVKAFRDEFIAALIARDAEQAITLQTTFFRQIIGQIREKEIGAAKVARTTTRKTRRTVSAE